VWNQIRYDARNWVRNSQARFFTMALPIIFLVVFVGLFGNQDTRVNGHLVRQSTYYVPAVVVYGVISASFMALIVWLVMEREAGILKRRQMTPEPMWVLVLGRAVGAASSALLSTVTLLVIGALAYGVNVPLHTMAALTVDIIVGTITFCCLAYAVTRFVRSTEAALPVTMALTLPLFFLSGVFVPFAKVPMVLRPIVEIFPIRALADAVIHTFDPATQGSGFVLKDLLILTAWGVAGLWAARRWFRWSPQAGVSASS
jgi:ABC-2 type transport system permease protein